MRVVGGGEQAQNGQRVGGGFGVGATVELENSAMSKSKSKSQLIAHLDELVRELVQLGFAEEADRAREIAGEVRLLRD